MIKKGQSLYDLYYFKEKDILIHTTGLRGLVITKKDKEIFSSYSYEFKKKSYSLSNLLSFLTKKEVDSEVLDVIKERMESNLVGEKFKLFAEEKDSGTFMHFNRNKDFIKFFCTEDEIVEVEVTVVAFSLDEKEMKEDLSEDFYYGVWEGRNAKIETSSIWSSMAGTRLSSNPKKDNFDHFIKMTVEKIN